MSKFKVDTTKFEQTSLSSRDIGRLFALLVSKIPKLDKAVNKSILEMKQVGQNYRLLTFGKDYVVVIRKSSRAKSNLSLGYPFPLVTRKYSNFIYTGFEISYYLRGQTLRQAQFANLIARLGEEHDVEISNIRSIGRFRNKLTELREQLNTQSLYYIDLYRFLGDSFLSTYMLDAFIKDFGTKRPYVLSRAAKHLNGFYKTYDLTYWANVSDNSIYVISDLLDIDDAWLQDILTSQGKSGLYIISSRNIFIWKAGNDIKIFKLSGCSDILLTNNNIFPYMQDCIFPFVKSNILQPIKKVSKLNIRRIYINPFSSLDEKSFSADGLQIIIKKLKLSFPTIQIAIPAGYDDFTREFSQNLAGKLRVTRLDDTGIQDLFTKLTKNDLVITVDTALTHIVTKHDITNIVVFKNGFWDPDSLQSLSAESPIAFCSRNPHQLPIVFDGNYDDLADRVVSVINAVQFGSDGLNLDKFSFTSCKFSLIDNWRVRKLSDILSLKTKLKYYK